MIRAAILCLLATGARAETFVAARTIPAQTVIRASDLVGQDLDVPGAVSDPVQAIGMEARVALYAGRPISLADIGFPAVVERNAIVPMIFTGTAIQIATEGRALDRAGPGDVIRVMNLSSRNTVTARIGADGAAHVLP